MSPAATPPEPAEDTGRELPVERDDDEAEPHDPSGLDLAQSMARALGARTRTPGVRRGSRLRSAPPRGVGVGPQVSGSHPDDRDPQRLGVVVERLVESKGWTTEVNLRSLLARWAALVGPVNAAHSQPEAYLDTVLTVRTDSTAWATQLRMLAPRLVAMLNAALGEGTVTRVEVRGPDAPSWKKGRLSVRDGRGPRDTYG